MFAVPKMDIENRVALDREKDAQHGAFRSRCAFDLTDPKLELQNIEGAIKLVDSPDSLLLPLTTLPTIHSHGPVAQGLLFAVAPDESVTVCHYDEAGIRYPQEGSRWKYGFTAFCL